MKKIFEIEWPNEFGENWINKDFLLSCIEIYSTIDVIKIKDITDDYEVACYHASLAG